MTSSSTLEVTDATSARLAKADRERPERKPRQTQAERREESERRLLDALIDIIAEDGVAAITFDAVGKRAGLSRGLASARFGSKAGMVAALIDYLHNRRSEALKALDTDAMTGRQALECYVRSHFDELIDRPNMRAYFALAASAAADGSEFRPAFVRSHERARDMLADMVQRGQADGSVPAGLSPVATGTVIGAMLFGAAIHNIIDSQADLAAMRDASLALFPSLGSRGETN